MKNNTLRYLTLLLLLLIILIVYLSTIGLETNKFNNQIKNRISQTNKNIDFLEVVIRCDRQYRNTLDWIRIDDLDIDVAD